MTPREQFIAFMTIVRKEIHRYLRIWTQTLLPSAITMSLYFVIFGTLIGARIGDMGGFTYMQFVVPGLIGVILLMQLTMVYGTWQFADEAEGLRAAGLRAEAGDDRLRVAAAGGREEGELVLVPEGTDVAVFGIGFGAVKGILITSILLMGATTFLPNCDYYLRLSRLSPKVTMISESMAEIIPKEMKKEFEKQIKNSENLKNFLEMKIFLIPKIQKH